MDEKQIVAMIWVLSQKMKFATPQEALEKYKEALSAFKEEPLPFCGMITGLDSHN